MWFLPLVGIVSGIYLFPRLLTMVMGTDTPTAVVISRSMWPVLNRGDVVFIKKATPEEIKIGTILIFHHNDGIAIHRVVRLSGDTIVTKGDANRSEDTPITFDDVVGRNPIWFGRPAKIPLVGQLALSMGPQVEVTQNGEPAPGPPTFVQILTAYAKSPLGLAFMVVLPVILLASALFGEASSRLRGGRRLSPMHKRRRERVRKRWPRARLV